MGVHFSWIMAANRESSVEESSEWAGISESGDDDMDFEVWFPIGCCLLCATRAGPSIVLGIG